METMFQAGCSWHSTREMKRHRAARRERTRHSSSGWVRKCPYPTVHVWMPLSAASQTHHLLWLPHKTLFGLSVTESVLSAAQPDTFHSLAPGFEQSQACDRSSWHSVAGRHLYCAMFEQHERQYLHNAVYTLIINKQIFTGKETYLSTCVCTR